MMANTLSKAGDSVVVIDEDIQNFDGLSTEFSGFKLEGDATQQAVLKDAKLHKADIFIATTHDDNINLMVAQVAKTIFKVPVVMARVYDPKREEIYTQLGISTVCPTSIAAERLMQTIQGNVQSTIGETIL
jgi:trk system potassium uptake protein TrkA